MENQSHWGEIELIDPRYHVRFVIPPIRYAKLMVNYPLSITEYKLSTKEIKGGTILMLAPISGYRC